MKGVKKYIFDKFKARNNGYTIILSSKLKKRMFIIRGNTIKINKAVIYNNLKNKDFLDKTIEDLITIIKSDKSTPYFDFGADKK